MVFPDLADRIPMSIRRFSRRRRGTSLVEIVVSVAILSLVLLSSLRSQIAAGGLSEEARSVEMATEVLEETIAELRFQSNEELVGEGGNYAASQAIDCDQVLPNQRITYRLLNSEDGVIPNVLDLEVQMAWTTSSGAERSLNFVTSKR